MEWAMVPVPAVRIELANYQWIEQVLAQFTMSYTTLSKYLRCPVSFYYESILRVPYLKSDALAFGSAVHNTLERMFKQMKEHKGVFPSIEDVLNIFGFEMYKESESFTPLQYDRRMEQGKNVLTAYYEKYIQTFATNVEIEFKIPRYILDGVPVTGKIDKIELDGDSCTVVDYKSGDPDRSSSQYTAAPNEKEPLGGDYWRQMLFYKLLIENYQDRNWKVKEGMFDYLERGSKTNEYKRIYIPLFEQEEDIVRKQLKDAYAAIMNHEFDNGCGKEDCYWCNFARKYELVRPAEEIEIDDI
jgi:DNA helicase-2/ATP-dependent DNA helicase PcrA